MSGILIGDRHTEDDWGLIWTDVDISAPGVQTNYKTVPGRDSLLDLTEVFGYGVRYTNRTVKNTFVMYDPLNKRWYNLYSEIFDYCHGKQMKVILDSDPSYYYFGRMAVEAKKKDQVHAIFTITCNAEAYKYDIISAADDWLWDPFSFVDGVARGYKDIDVKGTTTVTVIGSTIRVIPMITASAAMTVTFDEHTYNLAPGVNRVIDIYLTSGENQLTFTGTGTVTIDFKGRRL